MTDAGTSTAMIEFLRWVKAARRSYDEAMEAWQTSCPRSSVWEDASIAGYITLRKRSGETFVTLTDLGRSVVESGDPAGS